MQIVLDFQEGVPDTPPGTTRYCFVRCRSRRDSKVRVFGAFYLNEYLLYFEDGPCPQCPYPDGEQDCPASEGDGCPTTGWHAEAESADYGGVYLSLVGEVIGWAAQPEPVDEGGRP